MAKALTKGGYKIAQWKNCQIKKQGYIIPVFVISGLSDLQNRL